MKSIDEQVAILMHGSEFGDPRIQEVMTHELYQRLIQASREDRPLKVYAGYDPTAPDLHLGHTVTLRKLRQFQEFGHEVTFLIGTFTALIGDPSGRDQTRPRLAIKQVMENAQSYAEQAFKILDPEKTSIRYNDEWLSKLCYEDVINIASCFTIQQFLVRDKFRDRYEKDEPIRLHELLYALAQGYDAVFLQADVQIGATEQLFNLLAGRKLQEFFKQKPQVCITFPVLLGTDGKTRMSKSAGNYIGIDEPPEIQYGKLMSLPDEVIIHYISLVTRWSPEQIVALETGIGKGQFHPMEVKKKLAWEIVDMLHGAEAANAAAAYFKRVYQEQRLPAEMPTFPLNESTNIIDLLIATRLCKSKSEARRLVEQGAVKLNGEPVTASKTQVKPSDTVLQVGKHRFLRLTGSERT